MTELEMPSSPSRAEQRSLGGVCFSDAREVRGARGGRGRGGVREEKAAVGTDAHWDISLCLKRQVLI